MKLLIDTQSLIWFAGNHPNLTTTARESIEDPRNECYASLASFWEMSIKINLGKLDINGLTLEEHIQELEQISFRFLPIHTSHIIQNGKLPPHHKDPFDRILIAQAISEGMHIVSSDVVFDQYTIRRIW